MFNRKSLMPSHELYVLSQMAGNVLFEYSIMNHLMCINFTDYLHAFRLRFVTQHEKLGLKVHKIHLFTLFHYPQPSTSVNPLFADKFSQ